MLKKATQVLLNPDLTLFVISFTINFITIALFNCIQVMAGSPFRPMALIEPLIVALSISVILLMLGCCHSLIKKKWKLAGFYLLAIPCPLLVFAAITRLVKELFGITSD